MPLPVVVDKLDAVPEAQRGLYVEREGRFVLDVDQDSVEKTFAPGLKSALQKEREARAAREAELRKYEGIDPEKARQAEEAARKAEEERLKTAGQWDQLKGQLVSEHEKVVVAKDGEISQLTSEIHRLLVDNVATTEILRQEGEPALLMPAIKERTQVVRTSDGRFVVQVIDPETKTPRINGVKGEPMTIDQLVAELKADKLYGRAFAGTGATGSGASRDKAPAGGAGGNTPRSKMTDRQKSEYIKEHGLEAFKQLPA